MARSILQPEAGIFYGVCWIVVIIRLASRRMHRGAWKRLQLDDYLILVAMVRLSWNMFELDSADSKHRPQTPFS
jgi:hypothetical protein